MNRLILVLCFALAFLAGVLTGVLMAGPTAASAPRHPCAAQVSDCGSAWCAGAGPRGVGEPVEALDGLIEADEASGPMATICHGDCERRQADEPWS